VFLRSNVPASNFVRRAHIFVTPADTPLRARHPHIAGTIEDNGPGKNVLVRNKFVREDTGTHETLKILDDSMLDTQEEGIDPYNTGRFDRSRNWDKRRQ
jgi:hypothetical protein